MGSKHQRIFILVGPTASGKSAAAIDVAREYDGVIINADAMQMYEDLRIITARPTDEEMDHIPHQLYGVLDATTRGNAALWYKMAITEIKHAWNQNKLPILVGGTGMYIKCLMEGIAPIPHIPDEIKIEATQQASHRYLHTLDPVMAARLQPEDTQRIVRALEVVMATGESLSIWQEKSTKPAFPEAQYECYYLAPARDVLYARIDKRFENMVTMGALQEVERLIKKLSYKQMATQPTLPILKAHGVPELIAYLQGKMTMNEAIAKAQQHTRNYAKRQMTWIRGQMKSAKKWPQSDSSS